MADFEYTYKSWDKMRPKTLAKTGLGDQLKLLDKARAAMAKGGLDTVDDYLSAQRQIGNVEAARQKAISACGSNLLYKAAREALSRATADKAKVAIAKDFIDTIKAKLSGIGAKVDKAAATQKSLAAELQMAVDLSKRRKPLPAAIEKTVHAFTQKSRSSWVDPNDPTLRLLIEVVRNIDRINIQNSFLDVCKKKFAYIEQLRENEQQLEKLHARALKAMAEAHAAGA